MAKKEISSERRDLALRVRQIRENIGLTQEQFAERLGISLSAYNKIERAENQISLEILRRLNKELSISADYVLYGTQKKEEEAWQIIQCCSEYDKLLLLIRLLAYFTESKEDSVMLKDTGKFKETQIIDLLQMLQTGGERYEKKGTNFRR